ncbi:MAG: Fic family protein [Oscillospiraceae bacterium]|nr:Fic family protein [Oscillospiraceae bacterium]
MKELLARIDSNRMQIAQKGVDVAQLKGDCLLRLIWSSNALEGSRLTLEETRALLEDGVMLGGKPIRNYYDAIDLAEAYEAMIGMTDGYRPITEEDVRDLHRRLCAASGKIGGGMYRGYPAYAPTSSYPLPDPQDVPGLMGQFVRWLAQNDEEHTHPCKFAAQACKRLAFIHPFLHSNGTVARLLMNLCLLRAGYTPAVITPAEGAKYNTLLERAHVDDTPFEAFICEQLISTQETVLQAQA